jgi:formylglycine-generating enzyme required for sulfatase activity
MKRHVPYRPGAAPIPSGRTDLIAGWLILLLFITVAVLAVRLATPMIKERQERTRNLDAGATAIVTAGRWLEAGRIHEARKELETAERLIAGDPRVVVLRERIQIARDHEVARLTPLIQEQITAAEQLALENIDAAEKALRKITEASSTPPDLARHAAERESALAQATCILRFPADWPGDAKVIIDGRTQETTDGAIAGIEQGPRAVRLLRPGFHNPPELSLDFRGILPLEMPAVDWKPLPGIVRLTSVPSGAAVWRNDLDTGKITPCTLEGIDSGKVEFVLKHSVYSDALLTGELKPESTLELSGELIVPPSLPREGTTAGERVEFNLSPSLRVAFRWCPAGSFQMGRGGNARKVNLSRGFWIAETECTQATWESLTGHPFTTLPTGSGEGPPKKRIGPDFPACGVSWEMIRGSKNRNRALVETINNHLGQAGSSWKADLPTEAQWEYACRAGGSGSRNGPSADKSTGQVAFDDITWHSGNSGGLFHKVASKKPNPWGIHDMLGNVHEWCADWFQESLSDLPETDPAGPASGWKRVLRGGSCGSSRAACLPGIRAAAYDVATHPFIGFRLILRTE